MKINILDSVIYSISLKLQALLPMKFWEYLGWLFGVFLQFLLQLYSRISVECQNHYFSVFYNPIKKSSQQNFPSNPFKLFGKPCNTANLQMVSLLCSVYFNIVYLYSENTYLWCDFFYLLNFLWVIFEILLHSFTNLAPTQKMNRYWIYIT